jgi:hypothetical protein
MTDSISPICGAEVELSRFTLATFDSLRSFWVGSKEVRLSP